MNQDIERVKKALTRLKVFPLPNAVLLPGSAMGLHVFEPRYRELARDALAGDRVLGVAMLAPGWEGEYHGRPALKPMLGVGIIDEHEALPDGRYNLLVRGVARAEIESELPPEHAYREVSAKLVTETPARRLDQVETIRRCALDVASSINPAVVQPLLTALAHVDDPGMLCDLAGATLLVEPAARQRVLEATDVEQRLDVVVAELGSVLLQLKAAGGKEGEYLM